MQSTNDKSNTVERLDVAHLVVSCVSEGWRWVGPANGWTWDGWACSTMDTSGCWRHICSGSTDLVFHCHCTLCSHA